MDALSEARELLKDFVFGERAYGYNPDTSRYLCLECACGAETPELVLHSEYCAVGRAERWLLVYGHPTSEAEKR